MHVYFNTLYHFIFLDSFIFSLLCYFLLTFCNDYIDNQCKYKKSINSLACIIFFLIFFPFLFIHYFNYRRYFIITYTFMYFFLSIFSQYFFLFFLIYIWWRLTIICIFIFFQLATTEKRLADNIKFPSQTRKELQHSYKS